MLYDRSKDLDEDQKVLLRVQNTFMNMDGARMCLKM